jgi:hypothetical protein
MNIHELNTTLRCERALQTLAARPSAPLMYLEHRYDLEQGTLAAWLKEYNEGSKILNVHRIAEVKAKLGGVRTVRLDRTSVAALAVIKSAPAEAKPAKVAVKPAAAAVVRPPLLTADLGKWLEAQKAEITGRAACFQVRVTPALAQSWLQLNQGNRRASQAKIRRFAAAMAAGKWTLNGESIKFSASGRLLDGQSRLQAVTLAGVPVVLEVRAGLPDLAQQSMDSGEMRRGTHTLEMLGEANASILAAALKLLWLWSKGWLDKIPFGGVRVLENSEIAPLLAQHPALRASAGWTISTGAKIDRYLLRSEAAFFHYLFGTINAEVRDAFFDAVIDGLGLTKSSPAYHLRERLALERQGEDSNSRKRMRRALVIKAWNHALAGQSCSRLVFGEDDAFPEVDGIAAPEKQRAQRPRQVKEAA